MSEGSRALRDLPLSTAAVAMLVPASLCALYLWSSTPTLPSPHALHSLDPHGIVRPFAFLLAWLLMTGAMMLPSALPFFATVDRMASRPPARPGAGALAAIGYLGVWCVVGVAALAANVAAGRYLLPWAGARAGAWIIGGCLLASGLYGLSPLATACLRACRRPFGFLARHWHGGRGTRWQAVRIGIAYGISCVGCCVPMIGLMFVVGMGNLAAVILLGVLMTVMKSRSAAGPRLAQAVAVATSCAGAAVMIGWLPLLPYHHH
jgi:predicted metal-binding membrane protein